MLRYLNTDNGMVVEVPEWKARKYDASCNMRRLEDSPVESPPPRGDEWAEAIIKASRRKTAAKKKPRSVT